MQKSRESGSAPAAHHGIHFRIRTLLHLSVWAAAGVAGLAAVLYAKLVAAGQVFYLNALHNHPYVVSALSPLLFLAAAATVVKIAPEATGSGIPQVLVAIDMSKEPEASHRASVSRLVSVKTALVKVLSTSIGILGGASIGREGPTVQIASSGFAWVARKMRLVTPHVDFRGYLIAGAAAGVAAAFNTPLAGITFALEEIADGAFGSIKQMVMLSVILAGITAQALLGDYLYFGHPSVAKPDWVLIPEALLIGALGGIFGGIFARVLAYPHANRLPKKLDPGTGLRRDLFYHWFADPRRYVGLRIRSDPAIAGSHDQCGWPAPLPGAETPDDGSLLPFRNGGRNFFSESLRRRRDRTHHGQADSPFQFQGVRPDRNGLVLLRRHPGAADGGHYCDGNDG